MHCYQINIRHDDDSQSVQNTSFMGGFPTIPSVVTIPPCVFCASEQTFFFQLAFPELHVWHGYSLAIFHCTSCSPDDYSIPPMLQPPLKNAAIPRNFLHDYQKNFHLLVFLTNDGVIRTEYPERIRFKRWEFMVTDDSSAVLSKVGGEPAWLLEDEAPGLYADSIPMLFLFQLQEGLLFDTIPSAPPQASPYTWPGEIPNPYYSLFNSNELYAFGTDNRSNPLVYLFTQRD